MTSKSVNQGKSHGAFDLAILDMIHFSVEEAGTDDGLDLDLLGDPIGAFSRELLLRKLVRQGETLIPI